MLEPTIVHNNTRYVPHIGNADNVSSLPSSKGAVDGCVSNCNPNVNRDGHSQSGGAMYGFNPSGAHSGGPSGGLSGIKSMSNCGIERESGLGAGKQESYVKHMTGGNGYARIAQGASGYGVDVNNKELVSDLRGSYAPISGYNKPLCGGANVCHDLRKIKEYNQVHAFWSAICPGAVALYKTHLAKHDKDSHSHSTILKIIKEYTKAFCHEVKALKSSNKRVIKRELSELKKSMKKVEKLLHKIAPKAHKLHTMVERVHIKNLVDHLNNMRGRKTLKHKAKTSHKKTQGKRNRKKRQTKKHHKKSNKHSKTMKGGYYQYLGGTPYTPSHSVSTNGGYQMGTPGATLTNNCNDNYNHFTGKSKMTPIFDQDVSK